MQLFSSCARFQSFLFTTISVASKFALKSSSAFHHSAVLSFNQPRFIVSPSIGRINIRGGGGGSVIFSSSSSNSGVNGESNQEEEEEEEEEVKGTTTNSNKNNNKSREGQTGWNHNLPKDSSNFWLNNIDTSVATSEAKTNPTSKEGPRTGWLHTKKKTPPSATKQNKRSGTVEEESASDSSSLSKALQLLEEAKMKQKVKHRIISPPVFHACGEGRRAVVTEHFISVPLDYYDKEGNKVDDTNPDSNVEYIDVYFSIVDLVSSDEDEKFFLKLQKVGSNTSPSPQSKLVRVNDQQKRASAYKDYIAMKNANECILYLQGGPGFGAPRPINGIGLGDKSSWVGTALSKGFKRVVLMDQRGTGRSTTITKQTLEKKFPDLFALDNVAPKIWFKASSEISSIDTVRKELEEYDISHPELVGKFKVALQEATDYMVKFRADNIVRDAETIKDALLQSSSDEIDEKPRPWGAALGQSFGGFCMMSYLSLIENPPKICLLTGGIAPMLTNIDDVYLSLRERVKSRNYKYFERYPGDIALVKRIINKLLKDPALLPAGGILTARRFQQVGISLGGSPSSFASLHSLFSMAFLSEDDDDFSRAFLKEIESLQSFDDHPIYFLLHESIYADMNSKCVKTDWSAMRAYQSSSDFHCSEDNIDNIEPTLLVGEVVFPWMTDGDYVELSGLSMRALAHSIATKDDWGKLYDVTKMKRVLAKDGTGVSKAAAAVYYDDMYVDFEASIEVTKRGNPLEHCSVWVTNEYQHSGLRDDGATIFGKLLGMCKGEIGTPS